MIGIENIESTFRTFAPQNATSGALLPGASARGLELDQVEIPIWAEFGRRAADHHLGFDRIWILTISPLP